MAWQEVEPRQEFTYPLVLKIQTQMAQGPSFGTFGFEFFFARAFWRKVILWHGRYPSPGCQSVISHSLVVFDISSLIFTFGQHPAWGMCSQHPKPILSLPPKVVTGASKSTRTSDEEAPVPDESKANPSKEHLAVTLSHDGTTLWVHLFGLMLFGVGYRFVKCYTEHDPKPPVIILWKPWMWVSQDCDLAINA